MLLRKTAEHKAKFEDDSDEELEPYLIHVNNLLHSLFSNYECFLKNTMVYNANGLYPLKHKYRTNSALRQ